MQLEFYHFDNFSHTFQPLKSNWCWAACLEMIVANYGNHDSSVGICELVLDYLKFTGLPIEDVDFCQRKTCGFDEIPNWINQDLDQSHLLAFFKRHHIELSPIKIVETEPMYDQIIQYFKSSRMPILHQESKGELNPSHLRLLSGYGIYKGCQYILVSDPLDKKAKYEPIELLKKDSLNFWGCQFSENCFSPTKNELIHDLEVENQIIGFNARWDNYNNKNRIGLPLNPLLVFHDDYKVIGDFLHNDFDNAAYYSINLLKEMSNQITCNSTITRTKYLENESKSIIAMTGTEIENLLYKMNRFKIKKNIISRENLEIEINNESPDMLETDIRYRLINENGIQKNKSFTTWEQLTDYITKN